MLQEIENVLKELMQEIPGCRFLILIDTRRKTIALELWKDKTSRNRVSGKDFLHILDYVVLRGQERARNVFMRKALRGFRELTFELERGYVIFTSIPFDNFVMVSGITKEVKPGFWKALLNEKLRKVKNAGD